MCDANLDRESHHPKFSNRDQYWAWKVRVLRAAIFFSRQLSSGSDQLLHHPEQPSSQPSCTTSVVLATRTPPGPGLSFSVFFTVPPSQHADAGLFYLAYATSRMDAAYRAFVLAKRVESLPANPPVTSLEMTSLCPRVMATVQHFSFLA